MQFDYDWEPGENDSPARRWVRRVAFVLGIVLFTWIVALVSGGDAHGEGGGQVPQTSSTYRAKNPLKPMEWDSDRQYITAGIIDLGWQHSINTKREDLCALMETGYREKAVRSIIEGEDAYQRSFELDKIGTGVDWYFGAELLEVKCMRML